MTAKESVFAFIVLIKIRMCDSFLMHDISLLEAFEPCFLKVFNFFVHDWICWEHTKGR